MHAYKHVPLNRHESLRLNPSEQVVSKSRRGITRENRFARDIKSRVFEIEQSNSSRERKRYAEQSAVTNDRRGGN